MELSLILKAILSLITVILFMIIILKLIQKYGKIGTLHHNSKGQNTLQIDNIKFIDENTKIITLSNLEKKYILAVNKHNMLLLDKINQNEK